MIGRGTVASYAAVSPSFATERRQARLADVAVLATAAAIVGLFAISPLTLEHFGMSYVTSGGGVFAKFHPATFLCGLALGLRCLSTRRPIHAAWRIVASDGGVILLALAVGIAGFYAIAISKTPFTPLVDTFVLPIMCFLLLRDLDEGICQKIALAIMLVLAANAVIAIYEMSVGTHIVSLPINEGVTSDPTRMDGIFDWRAELMQDWRATALLGHPLVNGLIVGCFVMALASPGAAWLPGAVRWILGTLELVSIFAFGARTSLVLASAFVLCLLAYQSCEAVLAGRRLTPRMIAIGLVVIALAIGAFGILNQSGFFDRTIDRFLDDAGSARTRLTMLELFHPLAWSDLVLGPDPNVIATWQRLFGLEFGIESSWIGLILSYGIVVFSMIAIGLVTFSRSVIRKSGRGALLILVFYFISVSGSASMSGKTTTFAMVVCLAMSMLRRTARCPVSEKRVEVVA